MGTGIRVMAKALIASYLITGGLLFLVAFLLFWMEPGESLVSMGIQVIYVLSSFLGGLLAGKGIQTRRLFWGMLTGLCYYLLLLLVSLACGSVSASATRLVVTLALCLVGGTLGGILS